LCHDVAHTARTNIFEINSGSKLGTRYNDKSVLESHHAAKTFKILKRDDLNILKNLSPEDLNDLRKKVIANILATDIKEHFGLI
jgi:hypothetical protein